MKSLLSISGLILLSAVGYAQVNGPSAAIPNITANTVTITGSCSGKVVAADGTGCVAGGGGGGSGTVNAGTAGQVAYYPASAAAVSGDASLTDLSNLLTYAGTSGITASAGPVSSLSNGVNAGAAQFTGNTTEPTLNSNSFALGAPLSAAFTSYGWNPPNAENASPGILHIAAASGHWSAMTISALALTDMATQAADSVVMNASGSSAAPTAVVLPSCAASGHADVYDPSTHSWTCNAIGTGTVNSGTSGQFAYYASSTNAVSTNTHLDDGATTASVITASEALTDSAAGALSQASLTLSGAPVTGGSGTTTFPLFYANSGTAPTTWSTSGTIIGLNAPSGFGGNFIDFHLNGGAGIFNVTSGGTTTSTTFNSGTYRTGALANNATFSGGNDGTANSGAGNGTFRGSNNSNTGASVAAGTGTFSGGNLTGAATNRAGGDAFLIGGLGTGNSTPAKVWIQQPSFSVTSGTTAQTAVTRWVTHNKTGSTTTATATNMFQIAVATNQTIGVEVIVTVSTTQATPQNCSTTEQFVASVQNTSSTITQQTTAGTTSTICSTGTLTLAAAFSTATPSVFSVTPSWTTIAPSSVIITVEIHNLSQQDVSLL